MIALLCFVIGCCVGILVTSLCVAASDRQTEHETQISLRPWYRAMSALAEPTELLPVLGKALDAVLDFQLNATVSVMVHVRDGEPWAAVVSYEESNV